MATKHRLNIALTETQRDAVNRMAGALDTTLAGVFKTALALLEKSIEAERDGCEIAIVKGDKVVMQIVGITKH